MTVEEIQAKKAELELRIHNLIVEFSRETGGIVSGLSVDMVDITTSSDAGRRYLPGHVTVEITL